MDQMHVSLLEKRKAKCPDLASRLGLSFSSVVKMESGCRIRRCPPTKLQLQLHLKLKLTEQCCVVDLDIFMSAMFLTES